MASPAIVWFRQDLRLRDNPALIRAATLSRPVVAVFIWSPEEEGEWMQGAARRWWTHQALKALDEALKAKGSRLIIRSGPALETLRGLARETGASAVFWNRRWEPVAIARDTFVKEMLRIDGLDVESFNGSLLKEPPGVLNKQGKPFRATMARTALAQGSRYLASLGNAGKPETGAENSLGSDNAPAMASRRG